MNHTYTIFKKIRIKIRRIVRLAKILQEEEKEKIPNVTQHCKHRGWLTPRGMGGYMKKTRPLSLSLPIKAGRKERRAKERKREKTATISGSKRIQLTKLGAERIFPFVSRGPCKAARSLRPHPGPVGQPSIIAAESAPVFRSAEINLPVARH